MYAVRMTPLDRPSDAMDIPEFATPRDAWNELLTQMYRDQDAKEDGYAEAYVEAVENALGRNWNLPGEVKVATVDLAGDVVGYAYGVIETTDQPLYGSGGYKNYKNPANYVA